MNYNILPKHSQAQSWLAFTQKFFVTYCDYRIFLYTTHNLIKTSKSGVKRLQLRGTTYWYSRTKLCPYPRDFVWTKLAPELAEKYRTDPAFVDGTITPTTPEFSLDE